MRMIYCVGVYILCSIFCEIAIGQWTVEVDTPQTVFRKGRWIVGMSGSIASGAVRTDSISNESYNNSYGFDLSAAKFIKDRFAVGLLFRGSRSQSSRFLEREIELFYVGPQVFYYFSKSPVGSAYIGGSVGYARFRDETDLLQNGVMTQERSFGDGIGIIGDLGYAVAIGDNVTLDLGIIVNTNWVEVTRETSPPPTVFNETLRTSEIAFSFGFKVIL